MIPQYKLKNDKFRKSRGGYSRLLLISCAECKNVICHYQKDGPGLLKRMYKDRMTDIESTDDNELICLKCKNKIGISIIYEKENRPAYRLFLGSVTKKILKL